MTQHLTDKQRASLERLLVSGKPFTSGDLCARLSISYRQAGLVITRLREQNRIRPAEKVNNTTIWEPRETAKG